MGWYSLSKHNDDQSVCQFVKCGDSLWDRADVTHGFSSGLFLTLFYCRTMVLICGNCYKFDLLFANKKIYQSQIKIKCTYGKHSNFLLQIIEIKSYKTRTVIAKSNEIKKH